MTDAKKLELNNFINEDKNHSLFVEKFSSKNLFLDQINLMKETKSGEDLDYLNNVNLKNYFISEGELYLVKGSIISFDTANRKIDEELISGVINQINNSIYEEILFNINVLINKVNIENEMLQSDLENDLQKMRHIYESNLGIEISLLKEHLLISKQLELDRPYLVPSSDISEIYNKLPYHRGTFALESHIGILESRINNIEKYDEKYAVTLVELDQIQNDDKVFYLKKAREMALSLKDFQFLYPKIDEISYNGNRSLFVVVFASLILGFFFSLLVIVLLYSYKQFQKA